MLIGLYGMFATGKTTFLDNFKDEIADAMMPTARSLVIVMADLADEYWMNRSMNMWNVVHNKPRYKGSQQDKIAHIDDMIRNPGILWIVESARYFGGLQSYFIDCYKAHHGGLKFIIPVCSPDTARKFLMKRCEKRNKVFRAEYWTDKRLEYESTSRYTNVVNNHYKPAGVPCYIRNIDYERTAWEDIGKLMLKLSMSKIWYGGNDNEDLPDQGNKRKRQDDHSQAAIVRVPRN